MVIITLCSLAKLKSGGILNSLYVVDYEVFLDFVTVFTLFYYYSYFL